MDRLSASRSNCGAMTPTEVLRPTEPASSSRDFRVAAIIAAYNEADIIEAVLEHLVDNGVEVYLIDNGSTDDTLERARSWLGRGLIGFERFPAAPSSSAEDRVSWDAILRRKLAAAREIAADWYVHYDADEFRESPWPGCTLRSAIQWVDHLGFNAIDFRVLNFPPVDNAFAVGVNPKLHFRRFEEAAEYDRVQINCWKAHDDVTLADGGHQVQFAGRRVFPVRFILRHYPIRSQSHGIRKVFRERKNRFIESEHAFGWHIQYDTVESEEHVFLRNPASLRIFDLEQLRLEAQLEALPPEGAQAGTDPPMGAASLEGYLDRAGPDNLIGWACDRSSPERVQVDIFDGARYLDTVQADILRPDLAAAGIGDGRHGFSMSVPATIRDGRKHTIWANFAGTARGLQNSPLELATAPDEGSPSSVRNGPPPSVAREKTFEAELESVDIRRDLESR
jgi:hypothetical protein